MKILYTASRYSPFDPNDASGTDYDLYTTFLRLGADIKVVGPFQDNPSLSEKVYRKVHGLFSTRRFAKYSNRFLKNSAKGVDIAAEQNKPDLIFSFFAAPLAKARTSVPLFYMLDTTLIGAQEQWPIFSEIEYRRMLLWERKVLSRSTRVITCSEWAAQILYKEYGIPQSKVFVMPIPSSLPEDVVPDRIESLPNRLLPLHLLLVGREYDRKGIDIAIMITNQLNNAGFPAELRIVGLEGTDQPDVHFTRQYNKTIPADLDEYIGHYRWAHMLLHPARFEAAGIVPGEAAAFGVPTITNASGGLATTVADGVSGVVLPKDSPAEEYVKVIVLLIEDLEKFETLRQSTRRRYETDLNWTVAGKRLMNLMKETLQLPD